MKLFGARRWWAMAAMTLGVLAVGLDAMIVSVAMPTLAGVFHASETELQWFSASYALALAAAMLPSGLLGDRYGHKRVLVAAMALFGLGSVACALAPTSTVFIAARVVLGVSGAAMIVMVLSIITVLFSETERPRAVGVWAAANFLALPLGPILGGWMITNLWWGWAFLINVPVALLGLIAVVLFVPEARPSAKRGFDLPGLLSSGSGLVLLTYGLIEAGQRGWTDAGAVVPMLVGIGLLGAFLLIERRTQRPLVDLSLFDSPGFLWGTTLAALAMMAMIGILFTMPQYFQAILGMDAQGSGLRLVPLILGLVAGAVSADRIVARIGTNLTVALGFALVASAALVGSRTGVASTDAFIGGWMTLTGIGMGLTISTTGSAALATLDAERAGMGSSVMQAIQKLGAPFGAAILGSVLNSAYQSHLDLTAAPADAAAVVQSSVFAGVAVARQLGSSELLASVQGAFVNGMGAAFLFSAGISLVGMVLSIVLLPRRAGATTSEGAESMPMAITQD